MQLQAKEHQRLPASFRSWKRQGNIKKRGKNVERDKSVTSTVKNYNLVLVRVFQKNRINRIDR